MEKYIVKESIEFAIEKMESYENQVIEIYKEINKKKNYFYEDQEGNEVDIKGELSKLNALLSTHSSVSDMKKLLNFVKKPGLIKLNNRHRNIFYNIKNLDEFELDAFEIFFKQNNQAYEEKNKIIVKELKPSTKPVKDKVEKEVVLEKNEAIIVNYEPDIIVNRESIYCEESILLFNNIIKGVEFEELKFNFPNKNSGNYYKIKN